MTMNWTLVVFVVGVFASFSCDGSSGDPLDCTPACGDAVCGDDGCGGSCGDCATDEACGDGVCTRCGNGVLDDGETCDPSAEIDCAREDWCESDDACFIAQYAGSEATCDAVCQTMQIVDCTSGDGCCPSGCNPGNDVDCASTDCGNGTLDASESCDPTAGPAAACPDTCEPAHACETAEFWGFAEACTLSCMREEITACRPEADGCCPAGCTDVNDADCSPAVCGDGEVATSETCDSAIAWPTAGSCSPDCDDNRSCTVDLQSGAPATCDVVCSNAARGDCVSGDGCCPNGCDGTDDDCLDVVCGDGNVDGAEGCDNVIATGEPGACPSSADECDDGDPCTDDSVEGSAADCSARCVNASRACSSGDGCCPYNCSPERDNECAALGLCELYCFAAVTYCTGAEELFASMAECESACERMPVGREGDANGDSISCRIHHLEDAKADPEGHCEHSAEIPLGGCE